MRDSWANKHLQVPSWSFWKDPGGEGSEGFSGRLGHFWAVSPSPLQGEQLLSSSTTISLSLCSPACLPRSAAASGGGGGGEKGPDLLA